ncbi:hypothetical protein A2U01_0104786, partial [Trifolium medium]|nr:hypothetical protein [Trifolium medium]
PQQGQIDKFQVPGKEQRASSLNETLPRSASIHRSCSARLSVAQRCKPRI